MEKINKVFVYEFSASLDFEIYDPTQFITDLTGRFILQTLLYEERRIFN